MSLEDDLRRREAAQRAAADPREKKYNDLVNIYLQIRAAIVVSIERKTPDYYDWVTVGTERFVGIMLDHDGWNYDYAFHLLPSTGQLMRTTMGSVMSPHTKPSTYTVMHEMIVRRVVGSPPVRHGSAVMSESELLDMVKHMVSSVAGSYGLGGDDFHRRCAEVIRR